MVNRLSSADDHLGTLGARLFCKGEEARSLVWVAYAGFDFPMEAERTMQMWQVDLTLVKSSQHPSTRAVVTFHDAALAGRRTSDR